MARRDYHFRVSIQQEVVETAERAREASLGLALATRAEKDAALQAMADALQARAEEVLAANDEDVARAEADGTPSNIIDRLRLTPERLEGMAQGLREVAGLPDPVGEVVRGSTLANGCTSGHGVCGVSRLSSRSLAAVGTFMATGMVTVFVVRHVLGGQP